MKQLSWLGLVGMTSLVVACTAFGEDNFDVQQPSSEGIDTQAKGGTQAPMLNLSHIACTEDGRVEVHFVLLFWGKTTPPALNATISGTGYSASPLKNTGNVWHYNIYVDPGFIQVTSASVGTVGLHNADSYTDTYACGPTPPQCSVQPNLNGFQCVNPSSIGGNSPSSVCTWLGLDLDTGSVLSGRDEGPFSGSSTPALISAYVAVVKGGNAGSSDPNACPSGQSGYNIYTNVTAGQTLSTGNGTTVGNVTFCKCPD